MAEYLQFAQRADFRKWLEGNSQSSDGIWLLFGKVGGPKTLKASEALEEALCFGWIDGQMKSIDEKTYIKYFSQRRKRSKWSDKNKGIVAKLEEMGLMTEQGREKIREAKENGQWEVEKLEIGEAHIEELKETLHEYGLAYTHFVEMSPSIQKTYARAYFDVKTEEGRKKRLQWMIERLNKNLKPM